MRVPEGSDLTLYCHHDNAPDLTDANYKWTFRSKDCKSENVTWHKEIKKELKRRQVMKCDEGVYECVMDGYIGDGRVRISRMYNVSVGEPIF